MSEHISVLLEEAIEALAIRSDGIYIDMTLGGGGHSSEILKQLTTGHLYAFDQDQYAIERARERLSQIGKNFTIISSNFVNLSAALEEFNIPRIDGILYDLGVSSFQFDLPERGFSYRYDAPLDMRMNQEQELTAEKIINEWSETDLTTIFFRYGEHPFSKKIATNIAKNRVEKRIQTTFELVDIIKASLPAKVLHQKGHPAKQIFQALRIAVNDELQVFEKSLEQAFDLISPKGRIVVITFHSLEDRICKQMFKEKVTPPPVLKHLPVITDDQTEFTLVAKKPIYPSEVELEYNNRAHSAKMRVIQKK